MPTQVPACGLSVSAVAGRPTLAFAAGSRAALSTTMPDAPQLGQGAVETVDFARPVMLRDLRRAQRAALAQGPHDPARRRAGAPVCEQGF